MARSGEHVRAGAGDVRDEGLPRLGGGLVELAGDDERRNGDLGQAVDDRPVTARPDDVELVRAVHREVDRGVGEHLLLAVDEVLRHRRDAAHVTLVEDARGLGVLGVVEGAGGLVPVEGLAGIVGEFGAQSRRSREPEGHGCRGVADLEAPQPRGLTHGDLGAEHATPRLTEHVVFVEAEGLAQVVELVDEELGHPLRGRGVGVVRALAAPDLVVVHHGAPGQIGEGVEVRDVVVRHPRAAVQHEQGRCAGGLGGSVRRAQV